MKTEKFNVDVQDCWRAAMAHMNAKRNEANKIRADCSQPSHVPSEAEIKTATTGLGGSTLAAFWPVAVSRVHCYGWRIWS